MAATEEMVRIALDIKPDTVTLVPEFPGEITTQGGLDCVRNFDQLRTVTQKLEGGGIAVSLFIDPENLQIEAAQKLGVRIIEINTAGYSEATLYLTLKTELQAERALQEVRAASLLGESLGLQVHGGHGLTYRNVRPISAIPQMEELNIGHNIISRGILVGLERAVREMVELLQ
jgi:pyridoxine 5-phosphate synthase